MKGQRFIVELRFSFQTDDKLYFVMDFMPGGELFTHLRKSQRFVEDRARFYAAEILLALESVHQKGIIYRGCNPENILLDEAGHICLIDFGLCNTGFGSTRKRAFTFCGVPEYMAPEVILGNGHDGAVDYWALGVLLCEMLNSSVPFYSENQEEMLS